MGSGKSGRPGENDVPIGFRLVEGVKGDIPTERYGHSAVVHAGLMIVFGGCDNRGSFSAQTFIFDLGILLLPPKYKLLPLISFFRVDVFVFNRGKEVGRGQTIRERDQC